MDLELKTDGIYIQFGYRQWNNWMCQTSDCWYNIIKPIDNEHFILLGQFNVNPFYEMNPSTHTPYTKTKPNQLNLDYGPITDLYELMELTNPDKNFDPINLVTRLENFDWNQLEESIKNNPDGIGNLVSYEYPVEPNVSHLDKNITLTNICNCTCPELSNGSFSLVTYSEDTNSFYIKYSHSWIEGSVWGGDDTHYLSGTKESNGKQIPFKILTNSFKFTFVPFDLSEKTIWMDEYIKWKERYEYHRFRTSK